MKNVYLSKKLDSIDISAKLIKKLNSKDINLVEDLWKISRNNLKDMDLTSDEINQIIIKMQLHGLDLNKKVYNKN